MFRVCRLIGAANRSHYNCSELGCLIGVANRSNCNCSEFDSLIGATNMRNCNCFELGRLWVRLIRVTVTVPS